MDYFFCYVYLRHALDWDNIISDLRLWIIFNRSAVLTKVVHELQIPEQIALITAMSQEIQALKSAVNLERNSL